MSTEKIGIVGLGLIGGSLEKRLLAKGYTVKTVSKSQNREHDLKDLADCDILFLCGPQLEIKKNLEEIALISSQSGEAGEKPMAQRAFVNTIITDVGSTKVKICETASELGIENFIGGHPMAGTEKAGYDASFPELFEGATWILMKGSNDGSDATRTRLESVINDTGIGQVITMDPQTHDRSVAAISHLPLLLSLGLGDLLNEYKHSSKIIGPGFKGMTRLARGNTKFSRDLLVLNRDNVTEVWENFKAHVDSLISLPASGMLEEIEDIKSLLAEDSAKELEPV